MQKFLSALQFLTIFKIKKENNLENLKGSALYFPFVGLFIGAILCLLYFVSNSIFQLSTVAVIVVTCEILITRALHIDGFADFFDGMFGGHNREQKLLIMQDSRIGVFGAAAVTLLILLKIEFIKIYFYPYNYLIIFLAPFLSRWSILYLIKNYPYAKETGLGKIFELSKSNYWLVTILILAFAGMLLSFYALVLMALVFIMTKIIADLIKRQIGGATGDVYGFFIELNELVVFIIFYIMIEIIKIPFLWQIDWKNLF